MVITYNGFVWVRALGIDTFVVLDIGESLIHQTSIASHVTCYILDYILAI